MSKKKTILFFVTEDWYFCCHWLKFASTARKSGYKITVVTQVNKHRKDILDAGFKLIPIKVSRQGLNPFKDAILLYRVISIYFSEKPTIVHQVAMKPIVYGSIAAYLSKVNGIVNVVAGLGYIYATSNSITRQLQRLIRVVFRLYAILLPCRFVFQNPDDANTIFPKNEQAKVRVIKGVGVNINHFNVSPEPFGIPVVTLAGRLIWDKGIKEFVNASRIVSGKGIKARFVIVGEPDIGNPGAVSRNQLEKWVLEGVIEWWGHRVDMPSVYKACNVFCLPTSYGEGLPTVLLEAASSGRALISTDAPGCREIVRNGINGYLVPVRDHERLADAIVDLITNTDKRNSMAQCSREIVENEFSHNIIVAKNQSLYDEFLRVGNFRCN